MSPDFSKIQEKVITKPAIQRCSERLARCRKRKRDNNHFGSDFTDFQIQSSKNILDFSEIEEKDIHAIQRCSAAKRLARCSSNNGSSDKAAIDEIPDDILSEGILNKLQLTSLCACKCVSKLWSSLIMQNFHRSQRRLPIICTIGLKTNPIRLCSIDFDTDTGIVTPIYIPIYLGKRPFGPPICSNGFILFYEYSKNYNLVVFNPATHEIIRVRNTNEYGVSFGFDPCSNKYKIFGWKNYPRCEVYTLGTSSWRTVTSTLPIQGSNKSCSLHFCINGIVYWYSATGMIIYFHLGTESFGMIQGPNIDISGSDTKVEYMFDLEGCLCLAIIRYKQQTLDLWMLKDQHNVNSGWVLIARVNKPQGRKVVWTCPYSIRTDEILVAQCEEKGSESFYLYSFLTRQIQNIKICGQDYFIALTNFRENLASLKDL